MITAREQGFAKAVIELAKEYGITEMTATFRHGEAGRFDDDIKLSWVKDRLPNFNIHLRTTQHLKISEATHDET